MCAAGARVRCVCGREGGLFFEGVVLKFVCVADMARCGGRGMFSVSDSVGEFRVLEWF